MVGTVKTFKDGWGFIVSNQVAGDIYCHLKDSPGFVGELVAGEAVQFQLVQRRQGRNNGSQAVNIQRCGRGVQYSQPIQYSQPMMASSAFPPSGGTRSGTLKQWNDGWGWLQVPGHDDVFFGLKDNPHIPSANIGDAFVFEVAMGNKGKSKAVNAQPSKVGQQVIGHVKTLREGWGICSVEGMS